MTKYKLGYAVSALAVMLGSGVLMPVSSFADDELKTLDSCEGIDSCAIVTSTAELSDAFTSQKSTVLMGGSFDLTADLRTGADMDFYLNNYTLTSDGWSIINVDGDLTIYAGENGKIVETGGDYAPLYVYNNTTLKSGTIEAAGQAAFVYYDTGLLTMDGGTIDGGSDTAVAVVVSNGAKLVMNGGTITGDTWGISVFKDAEFEMNGGTVNATAEGSIGISGNGSTSGNNEGTNAKITLNAGTINSGDLGVYAPQANGVTTLGEGITINAAKCGVEVRAGTLSVNGATISVPAGAEYVFNPNGNGSTASGVAIAVAQHTTKQAISANVSSGNFTAPVVFGESNPQNNSEEDVAKVELSITGGTFNATNGDPIVSSEDVTGFVTGGTYNKDLDEKYIADGYVSALDFEENAFKVLDPNTLDPADEIDTFIDENDGEVNYIAPKKIDYENYWVEDGGEEEGHVSAAVEFGKELIADRKATLSAIEVEAEGLSLDENKGGELIGAIDIDMLDRDGEVIEVKDNALVVYIDIDEETHTKLAAYDKLYAVYFEDGVEKERVEAYLSDPDEEGYYLSFETSHLSTYAIVGVNETEEATASPDTGTMTREGGSAMSAAIVAAIAVGLIVSATSLAYLIRRK